MDIASCRVMHMAALTIAEVAQRLSVSPDTVYRLAAAGKLPGRKVGRVWRFSADAITRYLDPDATDGRLVEAAKGPRGGTP